MRRRIAILLCAALLMLLCPQVFAAPDPQDEVILRFGVCSDLHIGGEEGVTLRSGTSADRFAAALKELAADGIDALVMPGDILADGSHGTDAAVAEAHRVRGLIDACFPGGLPLVYTNGESDGDLSLLEETLGVAATEVNGVRFITVEGYYDEEDYYTTHALQTLEEELTAAAEDPAGQGKPIFVVTHATVKDTTLGSFWCASEELAEILGRFPQVILLAGHTQTPLYAEQSIMQTDFTAVDCGTFCRMRLPGTGYTPQGSDAAEHGLLLPSGCDAAQGLVVEVYQSGAVCIRRRDFLRREDIGDAWNIAPPDAEGTHLTAYAADRGENAAAPQFTDGAVLRAAQNAAGKLTLSVPTAEGDLYAYRFYIEEDRRTLVYKCYVPVWQSSRTAARPETVTVTLPVTAAVRPCRITAEPLDEWGNAGQGIGCNWELPTVEDRTAAAATDAVIDALETVTVDSGEALAAARAAYEALTDEQKWLVTDYALLCEAEARFAALFADGDELAHPPAAAAIRNPGNWSCLSVERCEDGTRVTFDRAVSGDVRTFGGEAYALDGLHLRLRQLTGDGVAVALTETGVADRYAPAIRLVLCADGTAAWLSVTGEPVGRTRLDPLGDTVDLRFARTEEGWICAVNGQTLAVDADYVAENLAQDGRAFVQFFALPEADPALSTFGFTAAVLHGGEEPCGDSQRLPRPASSPTTRPTMVVTTRRTTTTAKTTLPTATTVTAAAPTTVPTAPSKPADGEMVPVATVWWVAAVAALFGIAFVALLLYRRGNRT